MADPPQLCFRCHQRSLVAIRAAEQVTPIMWVCTVCATQYDHDAFLAAQESIADPPAKLGKIARLRADLKRKRPIARMRADLKRKHRA
jgi:hypothetical protein